MAYEATKSQSEEPNPRPWLTENFAERFRQVFGRDMSPDERAFFGLETPRAGTDELEEAD
jgi:hypothetical protein